MKILIIDDDIKYATTLIDVLEELHYEVLSITNDIDIDKIVKFFHPDIIFVDLKMPKKDGFTIAYNLKNIVEESVRLIGLSGYYNIDENHWLAKFCGFFKVINKSEPKMILSTLEGLEWQSKI